MLSVFPQFFNYAFFAPFLLRLGLAIVLLIMSYRTLKKIEECPKICAVVQLLSAGLFLLGFLVQAAATLTIIALIGEMIRKKIKKLPVNEGCLKFLIFVAALSLLFLGPGIFAIDLPL